MPDLTHTLAYRAVHGAVKNALAGHPSWVVPPALARSIAKRAAGTLMAHAAPDALAAARRSDRGGRSFSCPAQEGRAAIAGPAGGGTPGARLLSLAIGSLEKIGAAAYRDGDMRRAEGIAAALRVLRTEKERAHG
jgi:hypothetical protein